jgi:LPXTG-motif cell wall-anchored protein
MKHFLLITLLLLSYLSTFAGKCTGSSNCTACKSCNYCQHCAKNGGSCGKCASGTSEGGKIESNYASLYIGGGLLVASGIGYVLWKRKKG